MTASKNPDNLPTKPNSSFDLSANVPVKINPELTFEVDDFAGVTSSGLSLARVRIRQKDEKNEQGKTVAYAGDFEIYDRALDGMDITVADVKGETGLILTHLMDHESRVLFPKPYTFGSKPLCRSTDGVEGIGTPGGLCRKCPKGQFIEGEAPECATQREVLVYDHGNGSCYVLVLKRKAVMVYNNFISFLQNNVGKGKFPVSSWQFKLTTKFEQYIKGDYYLPQFHVEGLKQVDLALWKQIKEFRASMGDQFRQVAEDSTLVDTEVSTVKSPPAQATDERRSNRIESPIGKDRGGALPPGVTPVVDDDNEIPLPF